MVFRFDRQRFIQMKYRDRAFVQKLDDPDASVTEAFNDGDFESTYRLIIILYSFLVFIEKRLCPPC